LQVAFHSSKTKRVIAPLQCVTCNASLVLADVPSLACRFCGAINAVPEAYREELRLSRDLDEATRRAVAEWARLNEIRAPRFWFVVASSAPFVLMTGGQAIILAAWLLRLVSSPALPLLVATCIWLPLIPEQLVAAKVAMRNLLVSGAASMGLAFATAQPSAPGEPPECRQCGAPLSVAPDDILVRCVYCETESLVRLDQTGMNALRTRVGSAQSTLAQAMAALTKHARLATIETRGRTGVTAGLLVLPLVWSFVDAWKSSYWSLLIALDVWLLSVCMFWCVREAFLPPVTIEELERLIGPLKVASGEPTAEAAGSETIPERVPGTRGWYDNSSEAVNFVVPVSTGLMFVAIEAIVLWM
jgi:hypothetical protein